MSELSNSRRLRRQIERVLPAVSEAFAAVALHPRLRELYPEFLVCVHQMVRATVPLMRTALRRCRELEDTDPVAAAMAPYLEQHIKEELHHDDWLLEDLEVLGLPRGDVLRRMPSSSVASMIGGHYYWILHHHPVAKLGQIAVMEGYPALVETIDLLADRTGYPRAAFRTLEKHCHLDTRHRDDFDEALDRMPLGEEHHAILVTSARHTVHGAARIYRELVARAADRTAPDALMPLRRPDLTARLIGDTGSYRLEDPLHGDVYQLGEQEYFLLTRCDGRGSVEAARHAFAERFEQPLAAAELDEFLRLAEEEQLLAGGDE
jgi:hypothetical protein